MRVIAEKVGCHIDTIFRLKRGEVRPSIDMAKRLEEVLKIDRRRFMYPEEFGNAWDIFNERYK